MAQAHIEPMEKRAFRLRLAMGSVRLMQRREREKAKEKLVFFELSQRLFITHTRAENTPIGNVGAFVPKFVHWLFRQINTDCKITSKHCVAKLVQEVFICCQVLVQKK